jgi:DNA ligase-1
LGIGESFLIKAIAESSGRDVSKVKAEYVKSGDLGLIAMGSKGAQRTLFKPKPLTVNQVFKTLKEISYITGNSVS